MLRVLLLLTLLAGVPLAQAADYGREQRWADEILPALLDADPVWLEAGGHRFLALYSAAEKPRGAVILVHGSGVHPDWGIVGALRGHLPETGYATLSLQMPVLAADAAPESYVPTFPEAGERIATAVAWLQAKGYARIALVSHSLGGRMVHAYLLAHPDAPVNTWAALSMGNDDFKGVSLPILDVHAERDLPQVLSFLPAHQRTLANPASRHVMLPAADHFYEGRETDVIALVRAWLDQTL